MHKLILAYGEAYLIYFLMLEMLLEKLMQTGLHSHIPILSLFVKQEQQQKPT